MRIFNSAYVIESEPCGIRTFDSNLRTALLERGVTCEIIDIRNSMPSQKSEVVLFHYVPSMYANFNDSLSFFLSNSTIKIITILHGIYPNYPYSLKADTYNPYLGQQIDLIIKHSFAIISLSQSTFEFLESWLRPLPAKASFILFHPGFNYIDLNTHNLLCHFEKYFFFGGIIRPKKNVYQPDFFTFLTKCKEKAINIWVHDTKSIYKNIKNEITNIVWKYSYGQLSISEWRDLLLNSEMVLCPYNSGLQTVSGLIAESISLGRKVLSTSFPYAVEMAYKYPEFVILDNDIENWDKYMVNQKPFTEKILFPNWDDFIEELDKIIS